MFENEKKKMDDNQILQNARKGDLDAIKHVFQNNYAYFYKQAFLLMKDKQEAEDVVQECFANILSKPQTWETIIDFRWYIGRAVYNLCMCRYRDRTALQGKQSLYIKWANDYRSTETPQVLQNFDSLEKKQKVEQLLANLAPRAREAVELVYMQGLTYLDASNQMGISKNSLKTHIRLSMGLMRKLIQVIFLILSIRFF